MASTNLPLANTNGGLVLPSQAGGTNAGDIRPLKGPIEIPSGYEWLWWVLGAAVVAGIAWFLWRKFKMRKAGGGKKGVVVPAHVKAKERLRAASGLIADPYQFCSLVSDVLRTYIEDRFELRAPERTTEEFMDELRTTAKLHMNHKLLLEDFLTRCDLVKFARFEPTQPELEALLESASRFVDETSPAVEETATATSEGQAV
ncbi:MAG TPA: hypothetical protein VF773_05235 [Verrucomicrobiae bacterium]